MERLKDSLENLHRELIKAEKVDDNSKELLRGIMADIQRLLDSDTETPHKSKHSIIEDLKDSARKFELSHPELAGAINIVINSLSNIGI